MVIKQMHPCKGKYCDERWAQLHPGCIARAAPNKGMNMQTRWDNHRWNYTAFLLTGFDCSISSCLQNPTESLSRLGFSTLASQVLGSLRVTFLCPGDAHRHGPAAPHPRAGVCGMLEQRCSAALAPGGWKHYFPVDNGYPLLRASSRNPSPQPGPSPAQVSVCIQSPLPWQRGDALTASTHCWVSSSPLLSALSWSIPAHPMLSQLPTHQGERLRSF